MNLMVIQKQLMGALFVFLGCPFVFTAAMAAEATGKTRIRIATAAPSLSYS